MHTIYYYAYNTCTHEFYILKIDNAVLKIKLIFFLRIYNKKKVLIKIIMIAISL